MKHTSDFGFTEDDPYPMLAGTSILEKTQHAIVGVHLNPLHAKFIQREQKHIFTSYVISPH